MHNFAIVQSDSKIPARHATRLALLVQLCYRRLHLHCGVQRVFVVVWILLGTAEDGQDAIAQEFVDCSIMSNNHRNDHS